MRRWGLDPDPAPGKRWSDFLARNAAAIVATDFFTYEAWTPVGPRTLYALFFIQLDTRRVHLAGVTEHPDEAWMAQMARNMTMEDEPFLKGRRFLIADRDTREPNPLSGPGPPRQAPASRPAPTQIQARRFAEFLLLARPNTAHQRCIIMNHYEILGLAGSKPGAPGLGVRKVLCSAQ